MGDPVRNVVSLKAGNGQAGANLWSEYDIEPQGSLVDRPLRTLKHGDGFAVLDSFGDIGTVPDTAEGVFYRDTRFLSRFEFRIEGARPLLLSSAAHEDKSALTVDLTNPDIVLPGGEKLPRDTIFIERTAFLWDGMFHQRFGLRNFGRSARRIRLDFLYGADFRDLFEVRGTKRKRRGRESAACHAPDRAEIRYRGLDGLDRVTVVTIDPAPEQIAADRAMLHVTLAPGERRSVVVAVGCGSEKVALAPPGAADFFLSYRDTRRARRASTADIATVTTSHDVFDEVLCRAVSDIYTLATRGPLGLYPYAGIPWFSTVFGRDGIITAMLMLWIDPKIAKGVLKVLAATQATEADPKSDAQPGKILHELRQGEMANLGEVPFGRYYGTVDATPLFLMLAGMYLDRTGDRETVSALWPNIEAALRWLDQSGDMDGDGFVEYRRETESGLANQGWKDSHDAIFHADGSDATGPIALCEVQGYAYAGRLAAAKIARTLGFAELAGRLAEQAERLRRNFESTFWCEEIGTYALALDGAKRPCRVRASNAGHLLFTGICDPERAARVARLLMGGGSFSGWGIRTLATGEARFNPMSYHNGSVWPHDNALVALGFARYGLKQEAARVLAGLFDAAAHQELRRLPELFCGFERRPHRGPTAYPVACAPQAWASASLFGVLAASLGLEFDHAADEIRLNEPVLPGFLEGVTIRNLALGETRMDIRLTRHGGDVGTNVLRRTGPARIVVMK
ncbi:amylo-alpha-1,6-glucosidase [Propylenella binzhouense]|uniref:Amylo-alpha-1,6-glucosidase n=1 Tax=Propylenella binzhouense TaxID=2555902 RepID=A0A964T747_9HYPH|nr:amylo-alpha-1,6-glucosidase [Propylenella binzhouense]MYZ49330.1 amylo-alpha-1,6-glucosidase [Propylenella binzhouense]